MDWAHVRKYLEQSVLVEGAKDEAHWKEMLNRLEEDPDSIFHATGLFSAEIKGKQLNAFVLGILHGIALFKVKATQENVSLDSVH